MGSILIVDDEEPVRRAFQAVLEEEGHRVETAASVAEARNLLAPSRFDLVLTDLIFPGESGLDLIPVIKSLDEEASVIMVTGHPDISTAIEALKHGAYDYISKPVTNQELVAVVGRACERKRLITEKRRLERENADYQRSLEQKVEERTRDLRESERRYRKLFQETRRAYDELKEAHERLIRSERLAAIGELAARIAHEIRNPLGAISNSIGVLRRDLKVAGEDRRLLEVVVEESERLADIVSDFLKYARPRPPRKSAQRLPDILDNLLLLLSQDRRTGELVRVESIYEEGLPEAVVDPDHLREAVWNLLLNAAEAMPEGGVLRVEARRAVGSGSPAVEIAVSDTGKGIHPEEQVKIFQPFHTTKAEGTGLGLAIVQRIVDEHGGEIDLESAPGRGSTFVLRFPLTAHETEVAAPHPKLDCP